MEKIRVFLNVLWLALYIILQCKYNKIKTDSSFARSWPVPYQRRQAGYCNCFQSENRSMSPRLGDILLFRRTNNVLTNLLCSVSLHWKQVYLCFFVFKMYSVACYEGESRTYDLPGSHRKCEKPKMDKLFSLVNKEKFVTFFQFWYPVAVSHFKMDPFFGRKWKFFEPKWTPRVSVSGKREERELVFRIFSVHVTALHTNRISMHWSEILLT